MRGEANVSAALGHGADQLDRWDPPEADDVLQLAESGRLTEAVGIDPIAGERARKIATKGSLPVLQIALARIPDDLHHLIVSAGLPIETVWALHRQLGITTRSELAAAIRDRLLDVRVPATARIGRALQQVLDLCAPSDRHGIGVPLGRAWAIIESLVDALRANCDALIDVEAVGSLRRLVPLAPDLSLLCTTRDAEAVISALVALPRVDDVLHRGRHKASVLIGRTQIDLKVASEGVRGLAQLWSTGNEEHLSQLVRQARTRGFTLRSAGLFRSGDLVARRYETDADVYAELGLPCITPELRQGTGEIEAAVAGELPNLVTIDDIRGDLHLHSDWSDGHDTVEAMVLAARDLGYEYIAITDYSPSADIARTVTPERLRQQADEIRRLRERLPEIAILHGVEVDILPDGRLDLEDAALDRLDLVVASLHDRAGHDTRQLTDRYVAAMRHPLVNIISHPTNRLVGHRAGYELDVDTLFTTAVATGTILEIDGAPIHLDMDGALARRAVAAGTSVSIDSDAHRARRLGQQMRYGVGMARRGWVEARHVINTRPLAAIRQLIARKRAGLG